LDVAGGRTTAGEVIASMLADYVKLVQLIDNADKFNSLFISPTELWGKPSLRSTCAY